MAVNVTREDLFHIPLSSFIGNSCAGFGMDIGGTLIKVAYGTQVDDKVRIEMVSYPLEKIEEALDSLKVLLADKVVPGAQIYTTGFGCNRNAKLINEALNVTITNETESDCHNTAIRFLSKNLPLSQFVHPTSVQAESYVRDKFKVYQQMKTALGNHNNILLLDSAAGSGSAGSASAGSGSAGGASAGSGSAGSGSAGCASAGSGSGEQSGINAVAPSCVEQNDDVKEVFPCLVCSLGSGAFFVTSEADGSSKMLDINTSCGRAFLGMGSLLTGIETFDELISLAEKGNDRVLETKCGDVRVNDPGVTDLYSYLPEDEPVYCFGKAVGKKLDDFRREDVAAALVSQLAQTTAQNCHMANMASRVQMILLCGNVCEQSQLIRDEITKHLGLRCLMNPKEFAKEFYFLKHGGFLGAVGAYLRPQYSDNPPYTNMF